MDRKIILFELNEVPMTIVDRFVKWQPTSTLARVLPRCHRYVTHAEDQTPLSPWTTWPTLHRGVADRKHSILEFGQDLNEIDREFPPVWQILAAHGVTTGVCGSLHSYPLPDDLENYSFFLPDTFAAGSECFPTKLSVFQEFNLAMARESGRNVAKGVPWAAALRLLRSAPGLGLRVSTLSEVGGQLVSERLKQWRRVRRRTYQAVLAFDIFLKQLKSTRPDFATFFTNHVASSMHRYWAAAFPDEYKENGYDAQWIETFGHEIEFTMAKFDQFLAELVRFVEGSPDYQLWIASSMGQQATIAQPVQTQLYVRNLGQLMATLGMSPDAWEERPAMMPQVNVQVREESVEQLRTALDGLIIDGEPVDYRLAAGGLFSIAFGQINLDLAATRASLGADVIDLGELGLENVEIDDQSGCSAYHIPEGCMLIYDPRDPLPKAHGPMISALDVAPALLRNFSIEVPGYMNRGVGLA
jgi:hypothetical protein